MKAAATRSRHRTSAAAPNAPASAAEHERGPTPGLLLTAAHVAAQGPLGVRLRDGSSHPASAIRTAPGVDAALLKVDSWVGQSCQPSSRGLPCTSATQCAAPYALCELGVCALPYDQRPCSKPGASCGSCNGAPYVCGENRTCRAACVGFSCGMDGDVDCGGCTVDKYCADHRCVAPCELFECGFDRGMPCGTCPTGSTCIDKQCIP